MRTIVLNAQHKIFEIEIQIDLFFENSQVIRYKRKRYIDKLLNSFKNKYQSVKNSTRFKVVLNVLYTLYKDKISS